MTCQFFVMLDHFDHSILLQYHLCMLISTPYLCIYNLYKKSINLQIFPNICK